LNGFAHALTGATSGLAIALLEKEAIKDKPELLFGRPGGWFVVRETARHCRACI